MKLTIRVFAIAVVVAGFTASFHTARPASLTASHRVSTSAYPIPMCPPDGKTTCGIKQ